MDFTKILEVQLGSLTSEMLTSISNPPSTEITYPNTNNTRVKTSKSFKSSTKEHSNVVTSTKKEYTISNNTETNTYKKYNQRNFNATTPQKSTTKKSRQPRIEIKNVPVPNELRNVKQLKYSQEQYFTLPKSLPTSSTESKAMKIKQIAQRLIPKTFNIGAHISDGYSLNTPIGEHDGYELGVNVQFNLTDYLSVYGHTTLYLNNIDATQMDSLQGVPTVEAPVDFSFSNAVASPRHLTFGVGLQYDFIPYNVWSPFLRVSYQNTTIYPYTVQYNFASNFFGVSDTQIERRIPRRAIPKIVEFSLGITQTTNNDRFILTGELYYRHSLENDGFILPNRYGYRTGIAIIL